MSIKIDWNKSYETFLLSLCFVQCFDSLLLFSFLHFFIHFEDFNSFTYVNLWRTISLNFDLIEFRCSEEANINSSQALDSPVDAEGVESASEVS